MKWYELKPERVIPVLLGVLLTAAVFSRCGGGGNPPHPPTPPPPTPIPTPAALNLSIQGNKFFNGAAPFDMKALVWCCSADSGPNGWPMVNEQGTREVKRLGGNFLHIRLGPHSPAGEGNINSAFLPQPDGRADLAKYNPAFEAHVLGIVNLTRDLGMGVEVDFLDTWTFRTGNSAYCKAHNINGVDECGCAVARSPLSPRLTAFVTHWATILKDYTNVTFQTGNESFLCQPTEAWERSVVAAMRAAAPKRLIGSNTNAPWSEAIANYTTYHSSVAVTPRAKPAVVNETKDEIVDPAAYHTMYRQAKERGTYAMLWNGNRTKAQRDAAAAVWNETTPPPPTGDIAFDGDLPYLAKCGAVIPEPPTTRCKCDKPSGPCPGGAVQDNTSKEMDRVLRAGRPTYAGIGAGNRLTDVSAYMVSILRALQRDGRYCAKWASWDEVWIKVKGSNTSYGFDMILDPASGGRFARDPGFAVACTPAGL